MVDRERPIEVNGDNADLLAVGDEAVYCFAGSTYTGAHQDDDPFGVRGPVVVEELVLAAGELASLSISSWTMAGTAS